MWRNFWPLFLAALLCGQVEAWQALGNYHNDSNPGKCTINDNLIVTPGRKVKHPEMCAEILCSTEEGDAVISGCGAVAPPPDCEWGELINEQAPFQECCARKLRCADGIRNDTKLILQEIYHMYSPDLNVADAYIQEKL